MARHAKAAPRRRCGASGSVIAGRRDNQKYISPRTKYQPGTIDIYDGRTFFGSILAQRGRWVSYDASGHRIGTHDSERAASAAVYAAGGQR